MNRYIIYFYYLSKRDDFKDYLKNIAEELSVGEDFNVIIDEFTKENYGPIIDLPMNFEEILHRHLVWYLLDKRSDPDVKFNINKFIHELKWLYSLPELLAIGNNRLDTLGNYKTKDETLAEVYEYKIQLASGMPMSDDHHQDLFAETELTGVKRIIKLAEQAKKVIAAKSYRHFIYNTKNINDDIIEGLKDELQIHFGDLDDNIETDRLTDVPIDYIVKQVVKCFSEYYAKYVKKSITGKAFLANCTKSVTRIIKEYTDSEAYDLRNYEKHESKTLLEIKFICLLVEHCILIIDKWIPVEKYGLIPIKVIEIMMNSLLDAAVNKSYEFRIKALEENPYVHISHDIYGLQKELRIKQLERILQHHNIKYEDSDDEYLEDSIYVNTILQKNPMLSIMIDMSTRETRNKYSDGEENRKSDDLRTQVYECYLHKKDLEKQIFNTNVGEKPFIKYVEIIDLYSSYFQNGKIDIESVAEFQGKDKNVVKNEWMSLAKYLDL